MYENEGSVQKKETCEAVILIDRARGKEPRKWSGSLDVIEVVGMLNEDKNEEEESIIRFGSLTS